MVAISAIMAAVGAAASLASAGIGAAKSAQANREANALIQNQRDENKRWYQTEMNKDYMSRSDVQAILKKQRELLNEQYKSAAARNIVAGGTDAQLALQQENANKSLDNTMTNIAGQAQAHRDAVEQAYRAEDARINQQQIGVDQQKSQNIAQAASQGVSAGLNLAGQAIGEGAKTKSSDGTISLGEANEIIDKANDEINGYTIDDNGNFVNSKGKLVK